MLDIDHQSPNLDPAAQLRDRRNPEDVTALKNDEQLLRGGDRRDR